MSSPGKHKHFYKTLKQLGSLAFFPLVWRNLSGLCFGPDLRPRIQIVWVDEANI